MIEGLFSRKLKEKIMHKMRCMGAIHDQDNSMGTWDVKIKGFNLGIKGNNNKLNWARREKTCLRWFANYKGAD